MDIFIAFLVGLMIGGFVALVVMACLQKSKEV